MSPPEQHLQRAATHSLSHGQWVMAEGRKKKQTNPEVSWSLMIPAPRRPHLARSFSGTTAGTGGHFAPQSETSVISDYFVLSPFMPRWALGVASRGVYQVHRHSRAASSAMIHTWRIELSEADRMCNLHEWAKSTWSVSVKNERLSGFMTDSLSERMAGLPVAQKPSFTP